jgi:hypothetical protein
MTPIEMVISVSCHPRWPRQVKSHVAVAGVITYKCCQYKRTLNENVCFGIGGFHSVSFKVVGVKVYPRQTWNFRAHTVSACIGLWHHGAMHAVHAIEISPISLVHACICPCCMHWSVTSWANPWTNFSLQDELWAEFTTLEVAACKPCTFCPV